MGYTIAEQKHQGTPGSRRAWYPGRKSALRIDHDPDTQDATGTMAYLEFEAMGVDRVQNRASRGLHRPQHPADRL